jgi:fumarate hydratase, class II
VTAPNKFTAQGTLDRLVRARRAEAAAVTLFKIANDLRWLVPVSACAISSRLASRPG